MERSLSASLDSWRTSPHRKPLVLQGQRQVGKTWLLKEFGRTRYEDVAYFNLESNSALSTTFETTKDPRRVLEAMSVAHGRPIRPGKTLLILDEIQESNAALNTLKYFCEDAPEHHVACAGSLLGVALSGPSSFPVGKVDFLTLHPMTFSEFLRACGDDSYVSYLENIEVIAPIAESIADHLVERLARYLIVGGMPEPVHHWVTERDVRSIQVSQDAILTSYELDFAKHAPPRDVPRISHIWRSIPSQLARENRKFLFGAAREGARAREYEGALHWLESAGIVTRVSAVSAPHLPLAGYEQLSAFKIYSADTGLLSRQSGLDPTALTEPLAPFIEFKGALTENYVLQSLVAGFPGTPRYWRSKGEAEVEFLLQRQNDIHPIEVKSGVSVRSRSLGVYRQEYEPRLAVRFSRQNLHLRDGLLNTPLYMTDQLDRLIDLALGATC